MKIQMEQDANSKCASSFCAHRESESLMAENCSGGSGPSSSETNQTMFLFKDFKLISITQSFILIFIVMIDAEQKHVLWGENI